jgi:ubiquinone/menaquinone biosynthesis C-methylase UbiE
MPELHGIVNQLHRRTARDYIGRMTDAKVHCSEVARRFDRDYWDGDRRYGYGGYKYDGRWNVVAKRLVDIYSLNANARILDVGCGRGFLLHEFARLLPDCTIAGFDVSECGLITAKDEVRPRLFRHDARERFPFPDRAFDLAISINALHNLAPQDVTRALAEMERVATKKFLVVESFRTSEELFNLQCWALTCETFLRPESWVWLFNVAGYTGDYEFVYFEPPAAPA